jgi:hypothetical protein
MRTIQTNSNSPIGFVIAMLVQHKTRQAGDCATHRNEKLRPLSGSAAG